MHPRWSVCFDRNVLRQREAARQIPIRVTVRPWSSKSMCGIEITSIRALFAPEGNKALPDKRCEFGEERGRQFGMLIAIAFEVEGLGADRPAESISVEESGH